MRPGSSHSPSALVSPSDSHLLPLLCPPTSPSGQETLHADWCSGGAPRVPGRRQVQQGGHGSGHLGEPSLLQDVQRETQVTLDERTQSGDTAGGGRKQKANTAERRVNGWQLKVKTTTTTTNGNTKVTMAMKLKVKRQQQHNRNHGNATQSELKRRKR